MRPPWPSRAAASSERGWPAGAGIAVRRRSGPAAADPAADQGAAVSDEPESTFIDGLGVLLTTASYLVFGAVLLGPQLATMTLPVVVFAVLALTVMRMVPVAVSLIGARLGRPTLLFVGWFGPRGLASIIFTVLIVDEALPGVPLITTIVTATVALERRGSRRHGSLGDPSLRRLVRGCARPRPVDPGGRRSWRWGPSAHDTGRHPDDSRRRPTLDAPVSHQAPARSGVDCRDAVASRRQDSRFRT
jgi:hypothetical protein